MLPLTQSCDFVNDAHDLVVAHCWEHRERKDFSVCRLRDRTNSREDPELLSVERMKMDRDVVDVYADAARPQRCKRIVSSVDPDDVKMIRVVGSDGLAERSHVCIRAIMPA